MLKTVSTVDPITWYGERCDPTSPEWLVTGIIEGGGLEEKFSYRATIDPVTLDGTYDYLAEATIDGVGTTTKKGSARAYVTEADGAAILHVEEAMVTGVIVAGGTTQTVTLPVPGTEFVFSPAPRDCD